MHQDEQLAQEKGRKETGGKKERRMEGRKDGRKSGQRQEEGMRGREGALLTLHRFSPLGSVYLTLISLTRREVGESLNDNKGSGQSRRLICYCFLDPSPNFRMQGNSRQDIVLTCWRLQAGKQQGEQNMHSQTSSTAACRVSQQRC